MNSIQQLSDALAAAVGTAGQSVVRVEGRRRLPSSGIGWSDDGLILTASHSIDRRPEIRIGLPDGKAATARLLGRDPSTDVALLRAERGASKSIAHVDLNAVQVGHLVLALGRPGDETQATLGIVSATANGWRPAHGGEGEGLVQTDVVMYPGFSGGPLIDAQAGLIGMNTSGLARGVALAVPVPTLVRVATSLAEHGRIRRGYLGVGVQPARLQAARGDQTHGLLVASVEPGSPADDAGVLIGDVLVAIQGKPLAHLEDLLTALSGDVAGASMSLELLRGGERTHIEVKVGERPAPAEDE